MTKPPNLDLIRHAYDTVAADYARFIKDPGELDPLSRAMLAAFAELVRSADLGPTADVGCGPGKVTAHLAGLGVSAFGVDVSPKMVEAARAAHPGLRFHVGSMAALEADDGTLGGILAYYSTHHTPPGSLPGVFAEFYRALAPGGHLLLVTRVGEEGHQLLTHGYGGPAASFDCYRLPADRIAELLERAGFVVVGRMVQAPEEGAKRPVASFLVQRTGEPRAAASA
ncbi:class I SAM-dependent DNA methyltransferase [Streptomyces sp. NPDC057554]|uniref:class I SAM-dependent DNA methyltransferase n=1 Tax=Streptomyces sp. NPDC057554 TaxID=3350538 RepID=UPI0036CFD27F